MALMTPFEAVAYILLLLVGVVGHEAIHYIVGRIFGGGTFVSQRKFIIPTQIDFETPKALADWQVRASAGLVLIFPSILIAGLWLNLNILVVLGAGGSGISWLDLLALKHPEKWKKFTASEPISRGGRE